MTTWNEKITMDQTGAGIPLEASAIQSLLYPSATLLVVLCVFLHAAQLGVVHSTTAALDGKARRRPPDLIPDCLQMDPRYAATGLKPQRWV